MHHESLDELLRDVEQEARRAPFPIDEPIYQKAGKELFKPVLFAGSMGASFCVMGRDLGRNEVEAGQPLIGAGGQLVRRGIHKKFVGALPEAADPELRPILDHVLFTNTVPYKPPGNKAYAESVKSRFRPYVLELLTRFWQGRFLITLGNEAFDWFRPYLDEKKAKELWDDETRYGRTIVCDLPGEYEPGAPRKTIIVAPLPHPSPLNARWFRLFPELLQDRLDEVVRQKS